MSRANSCARCSFGHQNFCWPSQGGVFFGFVCSLLLFGVFSCALAPVAAFENEFAPPAVVNPFYNANEQVPNEAIEQSTAGFHNVFSNQSVTPSVESNDNISGEENEKHPSEVQKAVCTITAGEVKASAEAVTTKTLKGVCGSAELHLAVSNLEAKIVKELETLKILLQQLTANNQPTATAIKSDHCDCNNIENYSSSMSPLRYESTTRKPAQTTHPNAINAHEQNVPKLKSLPIGQHAVRSREKEVSTFNNTMLADKDFKVFTYYWRLENFTKHIENSNSITIESPRFAIKGKPLQLKAYFQHLHRDFLYLQLEYATPVKAKGNTRSSDNISLDMGLMGGGTLFKAISSNDQILFKYKISILDQEYLRSSKDLVSQEYHNLDGGFLIPNSALLGSSYIKNDTLLIQLFLYL